MAEVGSSKVLKKATAIYHDAMLKFQQLQKAFVAETNPAKRKSLKDSLLAAHKNMKSAELDFNKAMANEPEDFDSLDERKVKLKESIKGYIRTTLKK